MQIFNGRSRLLTLISATAVSVALAPASLWGQAAAVGVRKAEVSAFAAYTRVTPDYGPFINQGFTLGGDYTRPIHFFLQPSLEIRGTLSPGKTVGEKTFGGGLKAEHPIGRFRPYADFLVSAGEITYTHPTIDSRGRLYISDNSLVYTYGGGLDFDVNKHWAAKIDYQGEHWNLGSEAQTLTPRLLSIGVVYRIPFRSYSHP